MALHKHQTDQRLRASEQRLMIDHQGEGVAVLSPEGHFVFANAGAEEVFGLAERGLAGHALAEFMSPDGVTRVLGSVNPHAHGAAASFPITIERHDGTRRELLITATPARDAQGMVTGFFVVFRDAARQPGTGRIFCTNGRMLPEYSMLDGAPAEGTVCPLTAMRPEVERSLVQMQTALGGIVESPLTTDQRTHLGILQRAVERFRLVMEEGLMQIHFESRFIRLSREAKQESVSRH
jgi:PAS domain S-box-containing protein